MKISKKLFAILLVNFIGSLGFSVVIPFLVILVHQFGGNGFVYGLIGAIYPAFQLIGAPILGRWSDTWGRRPVLLLSQIGTVIGWLIFMVAFFLPIKEYWHVSAGVLGVFTITLPLILLGLSRAIDGLTGGNISVAQAYVADISTHDDRSKNFGRMGVSSNIGFIIGPALAGILGSTMFGVKLPVMAALLLSVYTAIYIWRYLPETKRVKRKDENEKHLSILEILVLPNIAYLIMVYLLIFLGFNFFYASFPIHAIKALGWTVGHMGMYFAFLSMMMAVVQALILPKLSERFADSKLIIGGSVILATNFILLASNNFLVIYLAAVFFALGNGLMWPSFLSLFSKEAGEKYQGAVQGLGGSASGLASIVGLIAGGILYDNLGSVTFFISAGIIYVVTLFSLRFLSLDKKNPD